MSKANKIIICFVFFVCTQFSYSQKIDLFPHEKAFTDNELLEYDVYYNWGVIWANAGWVNFSVTQDKFKGKKCFHFIGEGGSKPNWDWVYKVRDKYESYNDTFNLRPFYYLRNTNDGGHWVINSAEFNNNENSVYCKYKSYKQKEPVFDTLKTNYLTFDAISMIYYSRCLNFSQYQPGDIIPITIYLDNMIYYKSIKYVGKEELETVLGKKKCIKFKPSLIPGTLFKEGDEMTVWVTDDDNRVPVLVETPILVGSIKAKIKSVRGLKN